MKLRLTSKIGLSIAFASVCVGPAACSDEPLQGGGAVVGETDSGTAPDSSRSVLEPDAGAADGSTKEASADGGATDGSADGGVVDSGKPTVPSWSVEEKTPGRDAYNAVAVDASGNLFVGGASAGAFAGQKYSGDTTKPEQKRSTNAVLTKYSAAGKLVWATEFGAGGIVDDYISGVRVDSSGNVVAVGRVGGVGIVNKYDSSGKVIWTRTCGDFFVSAVVLDSTGAIIVGGGTLKAFAGEKNQGGTDGFVRKYDSAGGEVWTHQFGSSKEDTVRAIAVDQSGNITVGGQTWGAFTGQTSLGGPGDAFLIRYDSKGTLSWTKQFGTSGDDDVLDLATDTTGNLWVAGTVSGALPGKTASGGIDGFVRKLDATGAEVSTIQFGGSGTDEVRAITLDDTGFSVGGRTTSSNFSPSSSEDGYVRRYDMSGNLTWTRFFASSNGHYTRVEGLAYSATSGTIAVGSTEDQLGDDDAFVRTFDSTGK